MPPSVEVNAEDAKRQIRHLDAFLLELERAVNKLCIQLWGKQVARRPCVLPWRCPFPDIRFYHDGADWLLAVPAVKLSACWFGYPPRYTNHPSQWISRPPGTTSDAQGVKEEFISIAGPRYLMGSHGDQATEHPPMKAFRACGYTFTCDPEKHRDGSLRCVELEQLDPDRVELRKSWSQVKFEAKYLVDDVDVAEFTVAFDYLDAMNIPEYGTFRSNLTAAVNVFARAINPYAHEIPRWICPLRAIRIVEHAAARLDNAMAIQVPAVPFTAYYAPESDEWILCSRHWPGHSLVAGPQVFHALTPDGTVQFTPAASDMIQAGHRFSYPADEEQTEQNFRIVLQTSLNGHPPTAAGAPAATYDVVHTYLDKTGARVEARFEVTFILVSPHHVVARDPHLHAPHVFGS